MSRSKLVLALAALGFSVACTKTQAPTGVLGERTAPSLVADSFQVPEGSFTISLKKSSLKKAFLLIPSLKSAGTKAQWQDQAPILVSFERYGSKIAMLELVQTVYDSIESEQLISTFDVKEETQDEVKFEFAVGLSSLPMADHSANPLGARSELEDQDNGLRPGFTVKDSVVRRVEMSGNELRIEQLSRILQQKLVVRRSLDASGTIAERPQLDTTETTFVANFVIRPYVENANFARREPTEKTLVGFFTQFIGQRNVSKRSQLVQRWDIAPERGPIRVLLSNEVPAAYADALTEGVTYWNRVIGRDVLKVETNVDTRSVPPDRSVTVRWVPWNDAGFAYASMQADPLTGEVLRGQIFMTSSFLLYATAPSAPRVNGRTTTSDELIPHRLCTLEATGVPAPQPWKTDNAKAVAGKDILRLTIAHEMGHVLGLRHNFAGSFNSGYLKSETPALTMDYVDDPDFAGRATSTTVMDYMTGTAELFLARFIRKDVLSYDRAAIDWAYRGKTWPEDMVDSYCTDEDILAGMLKKFSVLGCQRHDEGSNPLLDAFSAIRDTDLEAMRQNAGNVLTMMFPAPGLNATPLDRIVTALENLTFRVREADFTFRKLTQTENDKDASITSIRSVRRYFSEGTPDFLNLDFAPELNDEGLTDTVVRMLENDGGFATMLRTALGLTGDFKIDPAFAKKRVSKVLDPLWPLSGKTSAGVAYTMTPEQRDTLKNAVTAAYEKRRFQMMDELLGILLPAPAFSLRTLAKNENQTNLAYLLAALANLDRPAAEGTTATAALSADTRLRAVNVFMETVNELEDASIYQTLREGIETKIRERLALFLGNDKSGESEDIEVMADKARKLMNLGKIPAAMKPTLEGDLALLKRLTE